MLSSTTAQLSIFITHSNNLNISRQDLTDLLNIATKDQLFQFEETLYEQFDGQKAADTVRRQLNDLGSKINVSFQPVFLSKKLEDELKITEKKPSIVNQQRVVYQFKCSFCDENYTGFMTRHLHERCEEH